MLQSRISQIGFAKQSAKGSNATNPTYAIGVTGGTVAEVPVTEQELPLTWTDRVLQGHERLQVAPGFNFSTIVTPKTIGLLAYAVTGSVADTGSGPYVHTCKPGVDLPYLGVFGRLDDNYVRIDDAKVDSMQLDFDRTGKLTASVVGMGCAYTILGSPYTPTTPEQAADGAFSASGQTLSLNGSSVIAKKGSIKISNKCTGVYSADTVYPKDIFPGQHDVTVSLTVLPADLSLFKLALTGSTSGTVPTGVPVYAPASLVWAVDANTTITLTVNNMKTAMAFPPANPAGGPVEIVMEGQTAQPAGGGDAYTLAVKNTVASY